MVPTSPQDLVQHLRGYEGQLPEAVRWPLVAAGASILPALIALVEDALAAEELSLSEEEIARLEEPYVPHPVSGIDL